MGRILITGVNGFVGTHLVRWLHELGHEIIGMGFGVPANKDIAELLSKYIHCDLTKESEVATIDFSGVGAIVSLAGLAQVGNSFKNPGLYKEVNVKVFTNLADELLRQCVSPRIIAISSGALYDPDQPMPLREESKTTVSSPYAESKLAMEKAVPEYRGKGLDCVVVRPFNHIGPGQERGFLLPDLYAKIKSSGQTNQTIKVGNLRTKRDYTDVRDIVRAYADLASATNLDHEVYNVCSGKSRSGEEILNLLLETMGLNNKIKVEIDQSLIRPNDPKDLYGSYNRIHSETGWTPSTSLEQTIKDFVAARSA